MFKIGSQRLAWILVEWSGLADDGSAVKNEIEVQVELVDRSALAAQIEAESLSGPGDTAATFAAMVAKDWKGVGDKDGNPLRFTAKHFATLLEQPGFSMNFGRAYLAAWSGQGRTRAGNSEPSPSAGGKAGAGESQEA